MESFEYTLSTDAFTFDGVLFPAETINFTRVIGPTSLSLTGQNFDGWALSQALFNNGNPFGHQTISLRTVAGESFGAHSPFDLWSVGFDGAMTPTPSMPTVTGVGTFGADLRTPSGQNGCPDCPIYNVEILKGTITETGINLPEPASAFLLIPALAYICLRTPSGLSNLVRRVLGNTYSPAGMQ